MAASKRKGRGTKKVGKKMARMPKKMKSKGRMAKVSVKKALLKVVKMGPVTSVSKPFTKGQLFSTLAGRTGMQRKEISGFFDELKSIISAHIRKQGPGQFTLPGLIKMTVVHKPATKARRGINPFTGEETTFKAKPARNVVKVRALKQLKEMV